MEYKYIYSEPVFINGRPIIMKDDIIDILNDEQIHNHTTYNTFNVTPKVRDQIIKGSIPLSSYAPINFSSDYTMKSYSIAGQKKGIDEILSIVFTEKEVANSYLINSFKEFYEYIKNKDEAHLLKCKEFLKTARSHM